MRDLNDFGAQLFARVVDWLRIFAQFGVIVGPLVVVCSEIHCLAVSHHVAVKG